MGLFLTVVDFNGDVIFLSLLNASAVTIHCWRNGELPATHLSKGICSTGTYVLVWSRDWIGSIESVSFHSYCLACLVTLIYILFFFRFSNTELINDLRINVFLVHKAIGKSNGIPGFAKSSSLWKGWEGGGTIAQSINLELILYRLYIWSIHFRKAV